MHCIAHTTGDFELVQTGDPLFVDLAGNVIPYRGSHGTAVYLMFINEGGYYYAESGTGIGVAVQSSFQLRTGAFAVPDKNKDHHHNNDNDAADTEYGASTTTTISDIGNFE